MEGRWGRQGEQSTGGLEEKEQMIKSFVSRSSFRPERQRNINGRKSAGINHGKWVERRETRSQVKRRWNVIKTVKGDNITKKTQIGMGESEKNRSSQNDAVLESSTTRNWPTETKTFSVDEERKPEREKKENFGRGGNPTMEDIYQAAHS